MEKEITKRVVKIFIDGKHRKSFPICLKDVIPDSNIDFVDAINKTSKSMTVSNIDAELLSHYLFDEMANVFLEQLKVYEKYIWELTINNQIEGVRNVKTYAGKERTELCFKNNSLKITCPDYFYKYAKVKLPNACLNY